MRVTRIIAAVVALVLAAAVPMLATGSATASAGKQASVVMKTRDITFQFRAQDQTYKFKGTVKPRSKSKNVTVKLLRAGCKKCKYEPFRSTKTNNRAKYAFTRLKRTGWFTVKVPASRGFATSYAGKSIHVFVD